MKDKIILYIDTSKKEKTVVFLKKNNKIINKLESTNTYISQSLLPLIEKLIKKSQIKMKDICDIKVHTGPGSFTGLRVGVAIANTLGVFLDIPVNGKKDIVLPNY